MAKSKVDIPASLKIVKKPKGLKATGVKKRRKKSAGTLKKKRAKKMSRKEMLSGMFGQMSKKQQRNVLRQKKPEKHI